MKRKDLNQIWKKIQDEVLLDNVDRRSNLLTLLEGSRIEEINETTNNLIVTVPNDFSKTILESEFTSELLPLINTTLNSDFGLVFFNKEKWDNQNNSEDKNNEIRMKMSGKGDSLKPEFTLDNFLASSTGENRLVKQASLSVGLKPGEWSPFFIYGGSGLGKTHLLHGIGNKILEKHPNYTIRYLESKDFKDLIYENGVNTKNIKEINNEFLNYDILLIDDIQMIQSLPKAKEVFFGIFSNYINEGKQIVITSDQYPEELRDFEERFITRFKGGVLMSVTPPDVETAKLILKQKIMKREREDLNLTPEAIEFVVINFASNIRELEGALNKIIFWSITNDSIKNEYTHEDMMDIFEGMETNRGLSMSKIVSVVGKKYQVSPADILGKSRKSEIVLPRHISIYFSRTLLNSSLMDIGRYFGRDHSTIMSSIKKVEKDSKTNQTMNRVIYDLRKKIISG